VSVEVRALTAEDLPACGEIVEGLSFFQDWGLTGEDAAAALGAALGAKGADLRVAVSDGAVIGFSWVVDKGAFERSAYLRLMAVRDGARGAGIGRALMTSLEADLLVSTDLVLLVTQTNAPARRFYERLGYRHVGTLPDYVHPGVDECIYFKGRAR